MVVRTTCPYCGTGCGVIASPSAGGGRKIEGDPQHPANFGKLCAKGNALAATLGPEGRLLHPEISGRRASWDQALDLVASRFKEITQKHGSESIAFYLSGQLLTEDYYVANKLAGFGTPHAHHSAAVHGVIGGGSQARSARRCRVATILMSPIRRAGRSTPWNHPILFRVLPTSAMREDCLHRCARDRNDAKFRPFLVIAGSDAWLFNGLLTYLACLRHRSYARRIGIDPPSRAPSAP
jgi:assimilatory nitrate reductase catalytic subunit